MYNKQGISTLVGIIIIIAVAVAIGVGVFAYQYFAKSQTPNLNDQQNLNVQNPSNETAGWKTFTNDKYGFEIKFPINEMLSPDDISMQDGDFYKDSTYKEIFIAMLKYGCDLFVYPNIDGRFLSLIKSTETYQLAILEHNGGRYYIGYRASSHAVRVSDCVPVFDQILPTFKFTK